MRYIYLVIFLMLSILGNSQNNLHFSQFYNTPLHTNPALVGQFPEDLFRFCAISRSQWSGINDNSGYFYSTNDISADFSLIKRRLGAGINILQDQAGGGVFTTMSIMPTLSYTFIMGDNGLSFGIQPMFTTYTFNQGKLTNPSPVPVLKDNVALIDLNFGANYRHDFYYVMMNVGVSGSNLLQPEQRFLSVGQAEKIPMYFKAYANVDWFMTSAMELHPGFLGAFQANSTNFVIGSNMSLKFSEMGENGMKFYFGLWGRTNFLNFESLIPTMGFQMNKVLFMTSYDYNLDLSKGGSSQYFKGLTNTFEISIIFTLRPNPKIPMPEDRFILNPRY